jgi:hypothetical protein
VAESWADVAESWADVALRSEKPFVDSRWSITRPGVPTITCGFFASITACACATAGGNEPAHRRAQGHVHVAVRRIGAGHCKHVQARANGQACLRHHVDPAYDHRRFQTCSRPLAAALRVHSVGAKLIVQAPRALRMVANQWLRRGLRTARRSAPQAPCIKSVCGSVLGESSRGPRCRARLRRVVA